MVSNRLNINRADGRKYEGYWEKDKRHGEGKETTKDG